MTADEIRAVLRTRPFKPFTIVTSDGGTFDVVHTDYAMLTGLGNFLLVAHPGQITVDWIDLTAITRLSFEVPGVAA